ncbi:hypothetical protein EMIHUDRAFT_116502 [Emiliania huxleyi CCMP1516]|uniref:Impact N-terminal domain-containing protein n=2 Tax=Emiliania huxleyi TaxID=2903 RepID=A0A0D3JII6_EMIH1|nr:hypothetical protein EMIHUDRAFT_116502 [Emiliania huxleyi CCMP1516]EOD23321.1 hypothetical protein EMIHUDRAFT_116502 [Emiliania huxleyi CCMP1516]|eukprot:XP_005775750.1 hypothetical protein EMIHUDRAFT_116502 [Emiliania huxleyi CCMP1516]
MLAQQSLRRAAISALWCHARALATTIAGPCSYEVVVKKSRFVASAAPVSSAEEALAWVRRESDESARHNCFAYTLSDGYSRSNNDGEPGGTAGPPIAAAIAGAGVVDVAVLVRRYRLDGGAKLGTGGLVRAYGGAAQGVLEAAARTPLVRLAEEVARSIEGATHGRATARWAGFDGGGEDCRGGGGGGGGPTPMAAVAAAAAAPAAALEQAAPPELGRVDGLRELVDGLPREAQAAALRWCDAHEAGAVSLVVLAELDQALVGSLPEEAAQAVGERLSVLRRQLLGPTS